MCTQETSMNKNLGPGSPRQFLFWIEPKRLEGLRVWFRREQIDQRSVDHLKAGESNNSCWRGSQQISRTAAVETRNSFRLKHFLYTVDYARIVRRWMEPLFLEPWANHLTYVITCIQSKSDYFWLFMRTKRFNWYQLKTTKTLYLLFGENAWGLSEITSWGYVNVDAAIFEIDEARATSPALNESTEVLSATITNIRIARANS